MRKATLLLLVALLSALSQLPFFVQVAYAREEISLLDVPERLGEAFGISTFAGGILATAILIMIVILPTAMLVKGKHAGLVVIVEAFVLMGFTISVGWLSFWFLVILTFAVALLFANKISEVFS